MVSELSEAPFIGIDHFARTCADDILEPSDCLFLYGFAEIGTQDKNSLVTPQRALPPFGFKPPTREQGSGHHPTSAIMIEQVKRSRLRPAETTGFNRAERLFPQRLG